MIDPPEIPKKPMVEPLGTSYPVEVMALLESDPKLRQLYDALPQEIQLDIMESNTMTPEALYRFFDHRKTRPSPATALLGEDENSQVYFATAPGQMKSQVWHQKFESTNGEPPLLPKGGPNTQI